jgi:hypothetical protein
VGLGGTDVGVVGTSVGVGDTGVGLGNSGVGVGDTGVGLGGTEVGVGSSGVGVGGSTVGVGSSGVAVIVTVGDTVGTGVISSFGRLISKERPMGLPLGSKFRFGLKMSLS